MTVDQNIARVQCPNCKAMFRLKAANLGRKVKCPKCESAFQATAIPSGSQPASPVQRQPAKQSASRQPTQTQSPQTQPLTPPQVPAGMVRCDRCHQMVPQASYAEHRRSHEGKREDGQLNEYPTLPPEERFQGDLTNVPRQYLHAKCGAVTEMPEEIIRTYLVNPFFYGYKSFCTGCGTHIRSKELVWQSTGQDLMTYTRQLQADNPNSAKYRAGVWKMVLGAGLFLGIFLAAIIAGIAFFLTSMMTAAIVFVVSAVVTTVLATMVLLNMRGGI